MQILCLLHDDRSLRAGEMPQVAAVIHVKVADDDPVDIVQARHARNEFFEPLFFAELEIWNDVVVTRGTPTFLPVGCRADVEEQPSFGMHDESRKNGNGFPKVFRCARAEPLVVLFSLNEPARVHIHVPVVEQVKARPGWCARAT